MAVELIATGVYQVGGRFVNSFIIDGDEGVTLVDTLLPKEVGLVTRGLEQIGRSFDEVRAILITHSHADHWGGAAAIKADSNALLYVAEADAQVIRGAEKPPVSPTPFYVKPLAWLIAAAPPPPPAVVDDFVSEASGDQLPGDLRAVDTPGHTPGHTSYHLDRDGGVLFVGDAARATKNGEVVRGYFNRSTPLIDASLRHLAELEFEKATFGHSDPILVQASSAFSRFAEALS